MMPSLSSKRPRESRQRVEETNVNNVNKTSRMEMTSHGTHHPEVGYAKRCPRWRHRSSGSIAATLPAMRRTFRLPSRTEGAAAAAVLLMALLSCCLFPAAAGLVIEEPFQATFDHVAAAFGPDVLSTEPPVESRLLVRARPKDACAPLHSSMEEGAIALVERGTCNFTQKVLHAQEAGASAVVVTDTRVTEKWFMVMYGDPENTQGIEIPAVLVSHATGERLWSNRSWIPGRSGRLRASVGATGHIVMAPRPVGALEMLGIYVLLSFLLLAFSGVCGLVFALTFTWYQRGYRTRAMRKLKSFTFRRRNSRPPLSPPGETQTNAGGVTGGSATSNGGGCRTSGTAETTTGGRSSAAAAASQANGGCQSCSNEQGIAPACSPRRQQPSACGDKRCEDRGGGGGAQHDAGGVGNGNGAASSIALGGEDSNDDNGGFLRAEDDDLCAICLETYEDGDSLTPLPCRHHFHTQCIRPWLSGKSALCPMCKSEAFGSGGLFLATAPRLEAAFAELAALLTENLAVLGLFFLASVACGVIAAKLSIRG